VEYSLAVGMGEVYLLPAAERAGHAARPPRSRVCTRDAQ
jgi:hypothetical protein